MTISKQTKRKNWSSLALYINSLGGGDSKRMKAVYNNEAAMGGSIGLTSLMLSDEIDEKLLGNIRDSFYSYSKNNKPFNDFGFRRGFLEIQKEKYFYFGQNSFFGKKEEWIYETLGFEKQKRDDEVRIETRRDQYKGDNSAENYFTNNYIYEYLRLNSVADHVQTWREFHWWALHIASAPDQTELTNKAGKFATEEILLPAAWASKHPELVDKNVAALADKIVAMLEDRATPGSARAYFEACVHHRLDNYINTDHPGAMVTVCAKYDTPEQAEAMLSQLDPENRYPFSADDENGRIHHLIFRQGYARPSAHIIHSLWKIGAKFDKCQIVDSTTLLCTIRSGLTLADTMESLDAFRFNACDLALKYKPRKHVKGDSSIHSVKKFPVSVIVETMNGGVFASQPPPCILVPLDYSKNIQELSAGYKTIADLALKLCDEKHLKMLRRLQIRIYKENSQD